jgi:hypothetical protein
MMKPQRTYTGKELALMVKYGGKIVKLRRKACKLLAEGM